MATRGKPKPPAATKAPIPPKRVRQQLGAALGRRLGRGTWIKT
jgi:hypothetical protein